MKKFGTGITYRDPQYWLRTEVRYGVNIRVNPGPDSLQNKKNCRNLHFEGLAIFFAGVAFPGASKIFIKPLEFSGSKCCGFLSNVIFYHFWSEKNYRKYDPGCPSRIRILIFYPSRIQGLKRQDPGSGSATPVKSVFYLQVWIAEQSERRRERSAPCAGAPRLRPLPAASRAPIAPTTTPTAPGRSRETTQGHWADMTIEMTT